MITITVRDGLGARVTTLANCLSAHDEVAFGWAENEHCPLAHDTVFPNGIPGVHFTEPVGDGCFTDWNARPFFSWDGAKNRKRANAAYARIMLAMSGEAKPGCQVGVCGRFLRNPQGRPETLAASASRAARDAGAKTVFLLCDQHRESISESLRTAGLEVVLPACPPLASDLARGCLDTRLFLDDWKTLLACPIIVAINPITCLLNPARAAGREIVYAT